MTVSESMLILPTLYIIKRDGSTYTGKLIEELTNVFNPSGEDARILAGRNDTKFSQKVRNLVSHRESNGMSIYTNLENGIYTLTDYGEKYLETRIDELNYLFSQKFFYEDTISVSSNISIKNKKITVYDENISISEGKVETKKTTMRTRSKMLRDAAIRYYSELGRLKCEVCGFDFESKYGEWGRGFIEIHHEKPICQYDEEGTENFISEAVKKVKPLCANCHRMIHKNPKKPLSIDELKQKIKY